MSIPQPYDTGLTEEQLAEAFRRALGDMTDEEIEKAISTAISLIPKGLVYRGAYNYFSDLPTNAKEGEVYTVKYKGTSGTEPDGNEYAWGEYEGTLQWIPLGVDSYTKNEIDEQHTEMQASIDENAAETASNKSDILSAKNDIAINRATLGEQRINIFDGELKIGEIDYETGVESGSPTAAISKNYILISRNATISISRSETGSFMSWRFYDEYKNFIGVADDTNVQVIHGSNISNMITDRNTFACFKVINPNIRYIRFRDATKSLTNIYTFVEGEYTPTTMPAYEPYVPSVNERLVEVENNKLNLNFGYVYSGYGGNTGWKRLAHCEFTPTSTGIIRDTTLYIEKMPGTERGWSESSECEGILKFRVLGNKNSNGTYSMGNLFINALLNKELPSDEIALIGKVEGSVLIAEIWCKITALYSGYRAAMISNTNRTNGVNPNTQTHWILDSSGTNVSAVDSYPAWTYTTTKIIDYYGNIIKDLSDRITALENK